MGRSEECWKVDAWIMIRRVAQIAKDCVNSAKVWWILSSSCTVMSKDSGFTRLACLIFLASVVKVVLILAYLVDKVTGIGTSTFDEDIFVGVARQENHAKSCFTCPLAKFRFWWSLVWLWSMLMSKKKTGNFSRMTNSGRLRRWQSLKLSFASSRVKSSSWWLCWI